MKTTPEVTIISLIYRSPQFARGLWENLISVTPEIMTGAAEFFFVANNANRKTLSYLSRKNIPHKIYNSKVLSIEEHQSQGFAGPEYIGRVYSAYNFGALSANANKVVLVNSDMVFSENWLTNLIEKFDGSEILSCSLVERDHPLFGVFPGAIEANFGSKFSNFNLEKWKLFSRTHSSREFNKSPGGAFMPAIFLREWFVRFGGFPSGNIGKPGNSYNEVEMYGDEYFFSILKRNGIGHSTISNSLCYHFKEGEKSDSFFDWNRTIFIPKMKNIVRNIVRKYIK